MTPIDLHAVLLLRELRVELRNGTFLVHDYECRTEPALIRYSRPESPYEHGPRTWEVPALRYRMHLSIEPGPRSPRAQNDDAVRGLAQAIECYEAGTMESLSVKKDDVRRSASHHAAYMGVVARGGSALGPALRGIQIEFVAEET